MKHVHLVLSVVAVVSMPAYVGAQIEANWIGVDGDYSDASQWSTDPDVPCNDKADTFDVTINVGGADVLFDLPSCTVASFLLGGGSTFTINLGDSYVVLGNTFIGGTITVDNGTFTAPAPDTEFTGTVARLFASSGAQITIPATTYNGNGIISGTIMSADGAGTLINLSSLTDINSLNNFGGAPTRTISATDNGQIDLSGLQSLQGGFGINNDRLDIVITGGGSIDFSSLTSITAGNVRFVVDDPIFALPVLESAAGMNFSMNPASTLNLPMLISHNSGGYDVPTQGFVNADVMISLTNATLAIGDQGTFNAPLLTQFNGSTLTLGPNQTLNTPSFTEIDNARLFLSGGVNYAVAATTYVGTGIVSGTVFSASGAGTILNLSSLNSVNLLNNFGGSPVRTISASDNGHINLSGLETLQGGFGINNDRLNIVITGGGSIDFSSLTSITAGNVRFVVDDPIFALPVLESAAGMNFSMNPASTLNLPMLITHNTGGYDVPTQGFVNADVMISLTNATLTIGDQGTFNAPNLTSIAGSTLTLGATQTLNTPPFTDIDNARILLSGGVNYAVAATTYVGTGIVSGTVFSASGVGTILDLSSLNSVNLLNNFGGSPVRIISASDNGLVNLSGLQTLQGGFGINNDRLDIVAANGGTIDMSTLPSVAGGNLRFDVKSEGRLLAGGMLTVEHVTSLSVDGVGSLLDLSSVTSISGTGGTTSVNVTGGGTLMSSSLELVDNLAITLSGPSTLTLAAAATMTNTTFNYDGGTINGNAILVDSTLNNGPGGTGAASFTFQGDCTLSGDIALGQSILIQGGGFGDANVTAAEGFVNSGVITLESINGGLASNLLVQTGVLENAAGGVININPGTGGSRILEAELDNRGAINVTTSDNKFITIGRAGANHVSSGSFTINATELDSVMIVGKSFTNLPGGVMAGVGALDVSGPGLTNEGIVGVGLSTGTLQMIGDYTQTSDGTLEIEIGGPALSGLFDVLDVTGTATLAGTMTVSLVSEFDPPIGESYDVVTAGAIVGMFDSVDLPVLSGARCWDVTTSATAVTLTVLGSAITQQPADQSVCEGDLAEFSVAVEGNVAASFQWRKDGAEIVGETADTLTILNATVADAGSYDVVVTNVCGSITSVAAMLTVNTAPTILSQPSDATVCEGDLVAFTVAGAGTLPLNFQWRKDGSDIVGETEDTLTINSVTAGDAGSYDVVVTNPCGSMTSVAATLTVNMAPTIPVQPSDATACEGELVALNVTGAGVPPPSFQWRKDGADIVGETGDTLTINSVTVGDAGSYDVVVTNLCGSLTSVAATLTVNTAPTILSQPSGVTVCEGEPVKLAVDADSTLPLIFQWQKDGVPLPGAANDSLTFAMITADDAGTYDVLVSNDCGEETSVPAIVDVNLSVPSDFDLDCDVDLNDFDQLFACVSGSGGGVAPSCEDLDVDDDGDVDSLDFSAFQVAFTGK